MTLTILFVYCLEGLALFVYLVIIQHMSTASGYKYGLLTIESRRIRNVGNLFSVSFSRLLTGYSAATLFYLLCKIKKRITNKFYQIKYIAFTSSGNEYAVF